MKNQCEINIAGLSLTVRTEYEPEYVEALAKRITESIESLQRAGGGCTKLQAALLCLLDATDAKERAEKELTALRKKAETDKLDMEILRIENEKLTGKPRS